MAAGGPEVLGSFQLGVRVARDRRGHCRRGAARDKRRRDDVRHGGVALMNSQDIAAALNEIAATSGKNAKAELIRKYGADRAFLRVVRAALDTFITYGISKMPADEAGSYGRSDVFDEST